MKMRQVKKAEKKRVAVKSVDILVWMASWI